MVFQFLCESQKSIVLETEKVEEKKEKTKQSHSTNFWLTLTFHIMVSRCKSSRHIPSKIVHYSLFQGLIFGRVNSASASCI